MAAKWSDYVAGAVLTAANLNDTVDNFQDVAIFREEQANNTNGGNSSASTWTKRTLNTTVVNNITGCSISSSVVTLTAGTYYVEGYAPAYNTDRCKSRIQNTTAASTAIVGNSEYAHPTNGGSAFCAVRGIITPTGSTNYELQFWGRDAATNGLGVASNASTTEVYSTLIIRRIA